MDPIINLLNKKGYILFPDRKDITDVYHEFIKHNFKLREISIENMEGLEPYPNLGYLVNFFQEANPDYYSIESVVNTFNKKIRILKGPVKLSFLTGELGIEFQALMIKPERIYYLEKSGGEEKPDKTNNLEYIIPLYNLKNTNMVLKEEYMTQADDGVWGTTSILRGQLAVIKAKMYQSQNWNSFL